MGRTPQRTHEAAPVPRVAADPTQEANAFPGQGALLQLRILRRLSPDLQVAALEAALAHALPAESHHLAAALLELALPSPFDSAPASVPLVARIRRVFRRSLDATDLQDLAVGALLRRWALLSDEIREVAVTLPADRWLAPLSQALTDEEPASRLSAARFSRDTHAVPDPVGLASLLNDPEGDVAREAEEALLSIAAALALSDAPRGRHRADLEHAVAMGATGFGTHRRVGAVIAAILLADRSALRSPSSAIAKWWERESALGVGVSRGLLRSGNAGLFRRRAWEWVVDPRWTSACLLRLGRAETVDDHEQTLSDWHLALNPRRAKAVRAMYSSSSPGLLPNPESMPCIGAGARFGAMVIAAETGAPAKERADLVLAALNDEDTWTRLGAANAAPVAALPDLQFDPDERVARRAILLASQVGESAARHGRVPEDASEQVRRAAALSRSSRALVSAWAAHELSRCELHASLAVASMSQHARRASVAALAEMVADADGANATRAVVAARRAGLATELLPTLVGRLQDPATDHRLAATCVAALGDTTSGAALGAIERSLAHPEPRVRANAVEAVAKQIARANAGHEIVRRFIELKSDPHHRVRANSLRAWIINGAGSDEAWEGLHSMLTADLAPSRLAAAWLAARLLPGARARLGPARWDTLAGQVQHMALQDPEPRVRDRAFALSDQLRSEWRDSWAAVRHAAVPPATVATSLEDAA